MTKGKLTPLALAIGFALCGTAFAGQNWNAFIDDNKTFDKTETIESDKATVVGTGAGVGSYPITLQIAPDAELTLVNTNTGECVRSGCFVRRERYHVYRRKTHPPSR